MATDANSLNFTAEASVFLYLSPTNVYDFEVLYLLEYNAVQYVESQHFTLFIDWFTLSIMKMVTCSSETSVKFQRTQKI
jgi:hypothetical protein